MTIQLDRPQPVPPAAPAPAARVAAPPRARRTDGPVDPRWAGMLAVAAPALFALMVAVEPTPDGAHATVGALDVGMSALMLVTFLIGVVGWLGVARRRRGSVRLLAFGAAGLLLGTLACPLSGHHALAGWWFVQLGAAAALQGLTLGALRGR